MQTVTGHHFNRLIAILLVAIILVFSLPQASGASSSAPCNDAVSEHVIAALDDCDNNDTANNESKNCICCTIHCHDSKLAGLFIQLPDLSLSRLLLPGVYVVGAKSSASYVIFEPPRLTA